MLSLYRFLRAASLAAVTLGSVPSAAGAAPSSTGRPDSSGTSRDTVTYVWPFEVLITAPRMTIPLKQNPAATTLVGGDVLESAPRGIGIDEAMKLVPGVKVDNQANGERVHLTSRGQGILTERGIRGIRILLDELPINDPTGFAPDVFDVDLANVERIEVLRGAAASLYGASATGGIINILTRKSDWDPFGAEASGELGSNSFVKSAARFGGTSQDVSYHGSFSRTSGDGYRDHTHFWGNNVYGKAILAPTTTLSLTPVVGWSDLYHENPEGISLQQYRENPLQANPDAVPYNEFLETDRLTAGLSGMYSDAGHAVNFSGYGKRTLFTEANNREFTHRTISTPGMSVQYSYRSAGSRLVNTMSIGTDAQWQTIDERRQDNLRSVEGDTIRSKERINQRGFGVFLLDKLDLGEEWNFTVCLRYDQIRNTLDDLLRVPADLSGSADFSRTTGRIGVNYNPDPGIGFYANWGQGFLPPATEELAQNPDNIGGFNTHLTFATSNEFDVGIRATPGAGAYADLAAFYLTTENDFDRYRIPSRGQGTFYRNIGASRRLGLELSSAYSPVRTLTVQFAYTFSDFTYTNTVPVRILMDDPAVVKYTVDGSRLPNSPAHQFAADARYSPVSGLTAGVSLEAFSKSFIDGANLDAEAVDGYTLLGARLRYEWGSPGVRMALTISGRNLTDTKYVAFSEPDPGGNAYQPGAGREFIFGLTVGTGQ